MKNINPAIWGSSGWVFLHSIAESYPDYPTDYDKQTFKSFFESLKAILPCRKCQINYKNHLNNIPLTNEVLSSNKNLNIWLSNVHNEVNKMLGKNENNRKALISIGLILSIIIIIVIIVKLG